MPRMSKSRLQDQFYEVSTRLMNEAYAQNRETLIAAGQAIADSIEQGGVLHLFGSGHSAMVALELIGRAGGLVPVTGILDPSGGMAETLPGYGKRLLQAHASRFGMNAGECVVVVSNSGKNPSPVEVAMAAKERGAKIIALSSLEMSHAAKTDPAVEKKLYEVADFVLDNRGVNGDAALEYTSGQKVGPTSTLTGCLLLNLLLMEILEELQARGVEAPLLKSQNLEGATESNEELKKKYRPRLSRL